MRISLRSISFSYSKDTPPIFSDLSLELQSPGFHSLFGVSGCGKSTLSKIAAGLLKPTRGSVETHPTPSPSSILYMHNAERFPSWMTVEEHLDGVEVKDSGVEWRALAEEMGIAGIGEARFQDLSMGQRNRANLLRYLTQPFQLLIIDEALANVDEPSRARILQMVKERFPDRTFLYISHNLHEVAWFSKRIAVFPAGGATVTELVEVEGCDGIDPPAATDPGLLEVAQRVLATCMGVGR